MCGVFDSAFFKHTLPAMPRLHALRVRLQGREEHGLGWNVIEAMLSAPQIREFRIRLFMFSPRNVPAPDTLLDHLARLTTFEYARFNSQPTRDEEAQRESLSAAVRIIHRCVEHMRLPSDLAPITTLMSVPWPQLRVLTLDGTYPMGLRAPMIDILSGMPSLRKLSLLFALPRDVPPQSLWPTGYSLNFPLPELEELAVSYPDPDDYLFPRLPRTLRKLSLRCCPHHCIHEWRPYPFARWHSPILRASDMLRILSSVRLPLLRHLQLEYVADDRDSSLLENLGAFFPNLSSIEVHRFREAGDPDVSMVGPSRSQCTMA